MTSDLRLSITFRDHPKVVKLHKMHGEPGISSLVTLWAAVAAYRPKGILYGMDLLDVEIAARWPGENGAFIRSLHDLRLVDCPACPARELWTPHGIVLPMSVHDWADHQGWLFYAEERSERGRAAAAARWGKRDAANPLCDSHEKGCGTHEKGMRDASKSDAPSPVPSPVPSPPPKKTCSSEFPCDPHEAAADHPPPSGGAPAAASQWEGSNGKRPGLDIAILKTAREEKRAEVEDALDLFRAKEMPRAELMRILGNAGVTLAFAEKFAKEATT